MAGTRMSSQQRIPSVESDSQRNATGGPMGQGAPVRDGISDTDGHVPTALAPLVGRRRERLAVSDVLRNPEVRLLVLTGPGGVGKTRLALSVVEGLRDSFRDGVA